MEGSVAKRIYLSPPHMSPHERATAAGGVRLELDRPARARTSMPSNGSSPSRSAPREAVALSSGTAALHLALILLGVGPGDEVLTSTLTFAATANAITYVGATPVFIDSDRQTPGTWTPTCWPRNCAACARRRQLPKAVIVVDLYGQCADYGPIREACRALRRADDRGRRRGPRGHLRRPLGGNASARSACFSFNGNKIITTSGGGMLVCQTQGVGPAGPLPGHAGPRSGAALPAFADRLQLPHEQPAGGRRPRAACACSDERVEQRRANYRLLPRDAWATCRASTSCPSIPRGRSTRWLTCITVDPEAFGADARGHSPGAGGREHRVPAHLEADAPAAGLRRLPRSRRRRGRSDLRARALPAQRIEPLGGRSVPRGQSSPLGGRLPAASHRDRAGIVAASQSGVTISGT